MAERTPEIRRSAARTPEEIRSSVEEARQDLLLSVNDLTAKVNELSAWANELKDWRSRLAPHVHTAMIAAGGAGFLLGGGLPATFGLFFRRRR